MATRIIADDGPAGKTSLIQLSPRRNLLFYGAVVLLVACAIGMRLYQLGLPFDRDGYDEGVYWQTLRAMSSGYSLYSQIFYSQPPFFMFSTYPAFVLFGHSLWAARLGIALVSLIGLIGAYFLGKALGGRIGGLLALLLLIVNPLYLAQSQTIEAEASSTAFSLLCIGAVYLWWENPSGVYGIAMAIITGVALALSVLCKLLGASCVFPVGMLILARLWLIWRQRTASSNRSILCSIIALILAGLLTTIVVMLPYLGSALPALIKGMVTFHSDAKSMLAGEIVHNAPTANTFLLNYLPLLLLALYGLIVAGFRRDWRVLPLLIWGLFTFFYLLFEQVPIFYRHFIAVIPALIGLAVLGLGHTLTFVSTASRWTKTVSLALLLVVVIVVGINVWQDTDYYVTSARNANSASVRMQAHVAADIRSSIAPDELIITDAQFIPALADRSTPPDLVDTSIVRINTHYVTLQQLISAASQPQVHAVLFFSKRFTSSKLASIRSFHVWVAAHFHLKYRYGPEQELWVR